MLFTELRFLVFFAIVFLIHWGMRREAMRKAWLLVASYAFYAGWDWRFLGLIFASTIVDYYAGAALATATGKSRKAWLYVSLGVNLGILGFFKYYNFFAVSATEFSGWLGLPLSLSTLQIVLPVGISFYTFQTLSYTLDIYRGKLKPCRSKLDFALFVAFFPQLVAGPIVRAVDFLPQLTSPRRFAQVNVKPALLLFFYGFVKKACVADNFGAIADQVFNNPTAYSPASQWLASSLYHVQFYCDFSGYSDMAIATAALLGYELAINFNFPYMARSLAGFWRRWHISLTTWFRDYIFVSLGGYRGGRARATFNLLLVFSACGLWHGASWNFVFFGLFHGIVLGTEFALGLSSERRRSLLGIPLTTLLLCISGVLFRTANLTDAGYFFKGLFVTEAGPLAEPLDLTWWIGPIAFFGVHAIMSKGIVQRYLEGLRAPVFAVALGVMFALALPWAAAHYTPFIYFQF